MRDSKKYIGQHLEILTVYSKLITFAIVKLCLNQKYSTIDLKIRKPKIVHFPAPNFIAAMKIIS